MKRRMLERIGLMISAYSPAPFKAAMTAAVPLATCTAKLRRAMNLNSLFLKNRALGTMVAEAKKRFTQSSWHRVRRMGLS